VEETVNDNTWPAATHSVPYDVYTYVIDNPAENAAYPVVIGRPGNTRIYLEFLGWLDATQPGSPALLVERGGNVASRADSYWLLSRGNVAASTVLLRDGTTGDTGTCTVFAHKDKQGRDVSCVSALTSSPFLAAYPEHAWYVSWNDGGGVKDEHNQEIRRLGQLLSWLLPQTGLTIDYGRCQSARAYLDRFVVDGYINESVNILGWIRDVLMPVFPFGLLESELGWYPCPFRWDATTEDARLRLSADAKHIEALSAVESEGWDTVQNSFTLDFQVRADTGEFNQRMILDATLDAGSNTIANYLCAKSQLERWGKRSAPVLSCRMVEDVGTAQAILRAKAARRCYPKLRRAYEGDRGLGTVEAGDIVLITDSAIGWNERLCMLERVTYQGNERVALNVITLEDPGKTSRFTT
jgi:hypothetical protein